MWFRKSKQPADVVPYPGERCALDGHAAAMLAESLASDMLLVRADAGLAEPTSVVPASGNGKIEIREVTQLREVPALLVGMSASGLRCAAFVDELAGIRESLAAAAGKRVCGVLHLTAKALRRQAGSLHGSHEDYYAAGNSGLLQFFARNVQEVADLALIAHRVSELALTPVICAQDFYATSQAVQTLHRPSAELVRAYLGRAGDEIKAPNPAQALLFGETRRRIPRLIDPDNPVGVGGVQAQESFFRAVAAQRAFFAAHVDAMLEQAMEEFASLTGRRYQKVETYRVEDADVVVLAMGAVADEMQQVADVLRETEGHKIGVLNLTVWRPFPGKELSRIVQGKRSVTVLERTDAPLAEDPPLLKELRSALDKALENGSDGNAGTPYPGYASFSRPADRPRLCSAIYGVGTALPSGDDLAAVIANMLPEGAGRRQFYVGVDFGRATRRYPHLQRVQQILHQAYPDLGELSVPAARLPAVPRTFRALRLHALSAEGGVLAGSLFASALAAGMDMRVRTYPRGGLEPSLQSVGLSVLFGPDEIVGDPRRADIVLVAGANFLDSLPMDCIATGGALVVTTNQTPEALWNSLTRRTEHWIREHKLRLHSLDARAIAISSGSRHGYMDELVVWALLGAGFAIVEPTADCRDGVCQALRDLLAPIYGVSSELLEAVVSAFNRGAGEAGELQWDQWSGSDRPPAVEREAPWTVPHTDHRAETVFDGTRFWHSVGFLYDIGQPAETLVDPYLATGIIPAASSAHRDLTGYRLQLPKWLPENCTGCGLCWAHCPDSALPSTVLDVRNLLDAGMSLCKSEGAAMIQLGRITGHLATQLHRLVVDDGLRQYRQAGPLFLAAFERLAEKMGLEGEQLETMRADFDLLHSRIANWPFARTEKFFDNAERTEKGSGGLLSIAVNPSSCKACGLCLAVCQDNAIEWTDQTAERVADERSNWSLQMQLPEATHDSLDRFIDDDPASHVCRLLNRTSYHAMVGGDGALPGSGGKTAVHLVSAAVDAVMQQRFQTHIDRLSGLIERLHDKIQGQLAQAVRINDFEDFADRLSRLEGTRLSPDTIAGLLDEAGAGSRELDEERLKRLTRVLAELEAQYRHFSDGRARFVLALQQDDITLWSGTYPDNPHASPWLSHTRSDAPGLAEGLFEGISRRLAAELLVCRLAERELEDRTAPALGADWPRSPRWSDLSPEERKLVPPVLVVAQSRGTRWGDLAPLLAGDYPVLVAILDSDGATVAGEGPGDRSVNHAMRALEQGSAFVLQGTTGYPGHIIKGVTDALSQERPALFRIYAPEGIANGISPERVAEDARRAAIGRVVPLFQLNPSKEWGLELLDGAQQPASDWADEELHFNDQSGAAGSMMVKVTVPDWAIHQARFRTHFRILSQAHLDSSMKPLPEYLSLTATERDSVKPFIYVVDDQKRLRIATVSQAMVDTAVRSLGQWRRLREMADPTTAASVTADEVRIAKAETAAIDSRQEFSPAEHQKITERLLALCGYTTDPDYFNRSLRDFLVRQRSGGRDSAD